MPNNITITDRKSVEAILNGILDRLDLLESKKRGQKKRIIPESLQEVEAFFFEYGYDKSLAKKFWDSYSVNNWCDGKNNPVVNWKQKAINVWFKPEDNHNKIKKAPVLGPRRSREEQEALLAELRRPESECISAEEISSLVSGIGMKI